MRERDQMNEELTTAAMRWDRQPDPDWQGTGMTPEERFPEMQQPAPFRMSEVNHELANNSNRGYLLDLSQEEFAAPPAPDNDPTQPVLIAMFP